MRNVTILGLLVVAVVIGGLQLARATYTPGRTIAARVRHSTTQTLTTGTNTALNFDTETRDDGGLHDAVTNNTRLTASIAGWYAITGMVEFDQNITGRRLVGVRLNGTTLLSFHSELPITAPGIATGMAIATTYYLSASDYVELIARQDSGGNLNSNSTSPYAPSFSMAWIAP